MSTKQKVRNFIADDCIVGEGVKEHTFKLYNAFRYYCDENFLGKVCTQNEFTNIMIEESERQDFSKSKFRKNGKNRVGFLNIGLKDNNK